MASATHSGAFTSAAWSNNAHGGDGIDSSVLDHVRDLSLPHAVSHVLSVRLAGVHAVVAAGGSCISLLPEAFSASCLTTSDDRESGRTALKGVAHLRSELAQQKQQSEAGGAEGGRLTIRVSKGEIASLAVTPLPSASGASISPFALGVVGTTQGSIVVFLLASTAGSFRLTQLAESSLHELSGGRLREDDVILHVAIVLDPLGRPELVVAGSSCGLIAVDTQRLHPSLHAKAAPQLCGGSGSADDDDDSVLRDFSASLVRRGVSEVFFFFSPAADIIGIVVPEHRAAAYAADVAFLVALSDGVTRYVKREIGGGSVALLRDAHRRLQGSGAGSSTSAVLQDPAHSLLTNASTHADRSGAGGNGGGGQPHVSYRYAVSEVVLEARPGTSAPLREGLCVNAAALYYNPFHDSMSLLLVGVAKTSKTDSRQGNYNSSSGSKSGNNGSVFLQNGPSFVDGSPAGGAENEEEGEGDDNETVGQYRMRRCARQYASQPAGSLESFAWWCVIEDAVLPELTLSSAADRARFYRGVKGKVHAPMPEVKCFSQKLSTSRILYQSQGGKGDGSGTSTSALSAVEIVQHPTKGALALCVCRAALYIILLYEVSSSNSSSGGGGGGGSSAHTSLVAENSSSTGNFYSAAHFLKSTQVIVESLSALPLPSNYSVDRSVTSGDKQGASGYRVPVVTAHGNTLSFSVL